MSLTTSDSDILLLHNPRCSKSRAALALLEERELPFRVRRYLDEPLSRAEIDELAEALGRPIREWLRSGEDAFTQAGLDANSSDAELVRALECNAILLERPILLRGRRAVVGRPSENLEVLL